MLTRQSQSSYFPHGQSSYVEEEVSSTVHHGRFDAVTNRYVREQERNDFHRQEEVVQRISDVALLNHGVHFPKNVAVLWDREGLTAPRYVSCQDIVPPLILAREDIKKLMKALQYSSSTPASPLSPSSLSASSSDMVGSVMEFGQLSDAHQRALLNNPSSVLYSTMNALSNKPINSRGTYGFVLDQSTGRGPDTSMTIPVVKKDPTKATITDLTFDNKNTDLLKLHLWKALRSGRSFGLRHFLRMRAVGYASSNTKYSNSRSASNQMNAVEQSTRLKGIVKFEVIVPDISFQFLGIPAIPILATPLCLSLLPQNPADGEEDSLFACFDQKPHMGFVTMNQTRKVVFVLESDANALSRIPMIGVWLRLPPEAIGCDDHGNFKLDQAIDHPLCWAACVRFLFSDKVQERVFIAHDTFLLVILVGDSVQFFEVTMINSKPSDQSFTSTGFLSKKGCELTSLDFTAELSIEDGEDNNNHDSLESLVCRFRSNLPKPGRPISEATSINKATGQVPYIPVKQSGLMSIHGGASKDNSRVMEDDSLNQIPPEPRFAPTPLAKPDCVRSSIDSQRGATSVMEHFSIDSNYSAPSAGGCYSSIINVNKDIKQSESAHSNVNEEINKIHQQSLAYHTPGVIPGHVLGIQTGPMMYTFPAQVIAAQQRQIEILQRQVEEMRELLVSLGGLNRISLPTIPTPQQSPDISPNYSTTANAVTSAFTTMANDNVTSNNMASSLSTNTELRSSVNFNNNTSLVSTTSSHSDLISFGSLPSSNSNPITNSSPSRTENRSEKKSSKQSSSKLSSKKSSKGFISTVDESEDMVDMIESQYIPTKDDKEEVLDRLIPNLHKVPMQTIVVSQQQPDVLLRMSDEEVIVSTITHDDREMSDPKTALDEEEPSIYDIPSNTISSLSSSARRVNVPSTINSMLLSGNHAGRRSIRYTHKLPSQSTAMRIAEEEASNFYESESILAIQTKYMAEG